MSHYLDDAFICLKGSLIALFMLTTASLDISRADTLKTYTIGIVPQFEARRLYGIWHPLVVQLEKETGLKFKLQGSYTISKFEEKLLAGDFDFIYMNPYQLIMSQKKIGYKALLRDHDKHLQGIIVVRKDSPFTHVTQLQGKTLAFPDPNALGASLLIRAELQDKYHINIIPRYVRTHDSVYLNVIYNRVDAGGGVQKTLDRQKPLIVEKLRVLYRTMKVAPHPFAAHPRVDNAVVQQVQQALLNMANTAQGRKLLAKIPINKMGPASIEDYTPLLKLNLEEFHIED